ncbi:uncharacterized protein LOC111254842 isoform X3 [Varroa destructor]|uniref:Uncharacterized protein n=1 Tax=Varroa destructor TaxID=109461 RepID=A0A7M7MJM4_VARDE|nr:uncharacterized protein LOC111254842 isoform X3 [Varroa destructor]
MGSRCRRPSRRKSCDDGNRTISDESTTWSTDTEFEKSVRKTSQAVTADWRTSKGLKLKELSREPNVFQLLPDILNFSNSKRDPNPVSRSCTSSLVTRQGHNILSSRKKLSPTPCLADVFRLVDLTSCSTSDNKTDEDNLRSSIGSCTTRNNDEANESSCNYGSNASDAFNGSTARNFLNGKTQVTPTDSNRRVHKQKQDARHECSREVYAEGDICANGSGSICSANSDSESFHSHSGYDELELLKLYHSYLQGDMKNATYNKVYVRLEDTKRTILDSLLNGCDERHTRGTQGSMSDILQQGDSGFRLLIKSNIQNKQKTRPGQEKRQTTCIKTRKTSSPSCSGVISKGRSSNTL